MCFSVNLLSRINKVRGAPNSLGPLWHHGKEDIIFRSSRIWTQRMRLRLLNLPCLDQSHVIWITRLSCNYSLRSEMSNEWQNVFVGWYHSWQDTPSLYSQVRRWIGRQKRRARVFPLMVSTGFDILVSCFMFQTKNSSSSIFKHKFCKNPAPVIILQHSQLYTGAC